MKTREADPDVFYVVYTVRDGMRRKNLDDGPHATEQKANQSMQKLRDEHGPAAWVHGHVEWRAK